MKIWSMGRLTTNMTIALCSVLIMGCSENGSQAQSSSSTAPTVLKAGNNPKPDHFDEGKVKFQNNCARCHGSEGQGTNQGPPLVHKIYEPSHHADMAFQRAAARGVRSHHWKFGDMPKIEGVSPDDVTHIIAYVRWLQRQAGIF